MPYSGGKPSLRRIWAAFSVTYVVGVTGGIGSGKSSVAQLFSELGASIIDTDEIAHRLTRCGQPALNTIARTFGASFILPDGNLDRNKMRLLIFSDPVAKQNLEQILHPLIKHKVALDLAQGQTDYALLIVPLLLETGHYNAMMQRILVVDCEERQQIERTMARSKLTQKEVLAIIASQISRERRLEFADDVLLNNCDLANLKPQVFQLHHKYFQLASAQ